MNETHQLVVAAKIGRHVFREELRKDCADVGPAVAQPHKSVHTRNQVSDFVAVDFESLTCHHLPRNKQKNRIDLKKNVFKFCRRNSYQTFRSQQKWRRRLSIDSYQSYNVAKHIKIPSGSPEFKLYRPEDVENGRSVDVVQQHSVAIPTGNFLFW